MTNKDDIEAKRGQLDLIRQHLQTLDAKYRNIQGQSKTYDSNGENQMEPSHQITTGFSGGFRPEDGGNDAKLGFLAYPHYPVNNLATRQADDHFLLAKSINMEGGNPLVRGSNLSPYDRMPFSSQKVTEGPLCKGTTGENFGFSPNYSKYSEQQNVSYSYLTSKQTPVMYSNPTASIPCEIPQFDRSPLSGSHASQSKSNGMNSMTRSIIQEANAIRQFSSYEKGYSTINYGHGEGKYPISGENNAGSYLKSPDNSMSSYKYMKPEMRAMPDGAPVKISEHPLTRKQDFTINPNNINFLPDETSRLPNTPMYHPSPSGQLIANDASQYTTVPKPYTSSIQETRHYPGDPDSPPAPSAEYRLPNISEENPRFSIRNQYPINSDSTYSQAQNAKYVSTSDGRVKVPNMSITGNVNTTTKPGSPLREMQINQMECLKTSHNTNTAGKNQETGSMDTSFQERTLATKPMPNYHVNSRVHSTIEHMTYQPPISKLQTPRVQTEIKQQVGTDNSRNKDWNTNSNAGEVTRSADAGVPEYAPCTQGVHIKSQTSTQALPFSQSFEDPRISNDTPKDHGIPVKEARVAGGSENKNNSSKIFTTPNLHPEDTNAVKRDAQKHVERAPKFDSPRHDHNVNGNRKHASQRTKSDSTKTINSRDNKNSKASNSFQESRKQTKEFNINVTKKTDGTGEIPATVTLPPFLQMVESAELEIDDSTKMSLDDLVDSEAILKIPVKALFQRSILSSHDLLDAEGNLRPGMKVKVDRSFVDYVLDGLQLETSVSKCLEKNLNLFVNKVISLQLEETRGAI